MRHPSGVELRQVGEHDHPEPLTAAELTAYPGVYDSPELETICRIVVEGDALVARHPRTGDVALTATEPDTFGGNRWYFRRVAFTRDAAGAVDDLRLSGGRVRNPRFVRLADGALGGPTLR